MSIVHFNPPVLSLSKDRTFLTEALCLTEEGQGFDELSLDGVARGGKA
ncbi:MAG: hypothetical protein KGN34_01930 [Sphingomonadales bacterium]|nr:hypothetical protein [Sphingomonadales bacterium]